VHVLVSVGTLLRVCRLNTVHGSLGKQDRGVVTVTTSLTRGLVVGNNRVRQEREALAVKRKEVTSLTTGGS
jgi:hypothetical protein